MLLSGELGEATWAGVEKQGKALGGSNWKHGQAWGSVGKRGEAWASVERHGEASMGKRGEARGSMQKQGEAKQLLHGTHMPTLGRE